MTSSGGIVTAERAARLPVNTVLSGPAGGLAAALHLGASLGLKNIITYDMGGTSTDVCLVEDLEVPVTSEQLIADQAAVTHLDQPVAGSRRHARQPEPLQAVH